MWTCENCFEKNGNNARKCHTRNCNGSKPQKILKKEQKETCRDFCPKCQSHQDFIKISKTKYKCPRCKRSFRKIGKPIPEPEKILKNNTVITLEN